MSIPKNDRPQMTGRKSHYFDAAPVVASKPRTVHLHVGEVALELQADRGVFGSRGIDLGTRVLLREAPEPPREGDILDLGSGYGHIAIASSNLDAMLARLAEQGIEPEKPPYSVREGGSRLCFVRDPDGYRVEILEMG